MNRSAFHELVAAGDIQSVKRLLADPSSIDVADGYALVPLEWIRQHAGDMMGLQLMLLRASATNDVPKSKHFFLDNCLPSIDSEDDKGFTALHYAVKGGNTDLARLLVSYGADVDRKSRIDNDGTSENAITMAVKQGDIAMFKLLVDSGANLEDQRRLLHYPIASKELDRSRELVTAIVQVSSSVSTSVYTTLSVAATAIAVHPSPH